jgi:hypothetical protein
VRFAAITLCIASQHVFTVVIFVYFVMTQSGNFWIHSRMGSIMLPTVCSAEVAFSSVLAAYGNQIKLTVTHNMDLAD